MNFRLSENGETEVKIAVSGKGGVGKTLIAGVIACSLAKAGLKTIAIDADPSPNLALTLGLSQEEAHKIVPISENKELIRLKTGTGYSGVFRLSFTVDDIVRDYSVETPFNVNLIVMGTVRSMGSGCACPENAVIRALLRHLVVERNEGVVLDMEAGIEHIGRGTARHVNTMLIVADANMKALEIARNIHELSSKAGMKQIFLVGNKIANAIQKETIENFAGKYGLNILGFVPFDKKVLEMEMLGETPLKSKESEAVHAVEELCERLDEKHLISWK
ncbi:MAG: P-loop NTPase [Candidatus Bathyarchaeota archaeon]|nr:P-loop NTPase [Candidatus Bathyarchaeota archaeon]MDH5786950.1 P-loop NTPase [Candidatus Bathyarchaeota archaeon]